MTATRQVRRRTIPPRAAVLVESLRDVGYSLQTAVADVIDNSVAAKASNVRLFAETHPDSPAIAILDDGCGMSEEELLEAMRPGSKSPLDRRPVHDLGRFGLGLKTASFSQCRQVTVMTRRNGRTSCAVWDLDEVASADEWVVTLPSDYAQIPWSGELGATGTLVVWQKLDRLLVAVDAPTGGAELVRQLDDMARHLELVFHRYLAGERGLRRVDISLNGQRLEPFDPFHLRHPATIRGPEERFRVGGHVLTFQPMTLPHHSKVATKEWERYAGPEGYIKNQGFYLYRERRLIISGTWFGLARQTELTKLARVRIDIPNGLDAEWKIDVKKASAQPPASVRARLRRLVEEIGSRSTRVYTGRGSRLQSTNRLPVWIRSQDKNQVRYGVDLEHPALGHFVRQLSPEVASEFGKVLRLVSASLPVDAIFADVGSDPRAVAGVALENGELRDFAKKIYDTLVAAGSSRDDVLLMMSSAEPFRANWDALQTQLDTRE
ncbi:MAG: ATP-binding protein [Gammaproteobacteria bacterium]|nr:ATP-binding protein [Gammaproteobacteria bacterium]